MSSKRKLVSNYVRVFVGQDGGEIRFRPRRDEAGRLCWEVLGVHPDGTPELVTSSNTGRPKILRSADAVVSYWRGLYPDRSCLRLPVNPDTPDLT